MNQLPQEKDFIVTAAIKLKAFTPKNVAEILNQRMYDMDVTLTSYPSEVKPIVKKLL